MAGNNIYVQGSYIDIHDNQVVNLSVDKGEVHAGAPSYSDEQVATALANITGKGKPIDSKRKWAGAIWLLRWVCNYPSNTRLACERINSLPLPEDLEYVCDYRNVRELTTLSFLNEDARHMESVKYSKNDEGVFMELRKVAIALDEELQRMNDYKACVNM